MAAKTFSAQPSFQPIPPGILWCFGIMISIPSSAQPRFQTIPWGILRCLGIMISPSFQHSGPFKYPPCGVFHSVVNIPLESDPLELSFSTFIWGRRESCLGHTSIDFELRRATRRSVSRCRELGRRKRSRWIELGLGYPTQACCRTCISRSPMTRACSLMVGSRVDGSNVLVAMHNYHGCAWNVGHGNGNAQPSWMVGSKEVVVIHTHRGCTVMFIANHGRGNRIGNVGHRCYTCNAGHVDNDRHLLNQRW